LSLTKEHIDQFKNVILSNDTIKQMFFYAQKAYPNESCGFVFDDGGVLGANNAIEEMRQPSLNAKNAFLIDANSWAIAKSSGKRIMCIFHSHNNGSSDMSDADVHMLNLDKICYIIIGMLDHNPVSVKIHWWEQGELRSEEISTDKKE
jgi:proteasome lid subunit RPN8/RPN11